MHDGLDLSCLEPTAQPAAVTAYGQSDGAAFAQSVVPRSHMLRAIIDNWDALNARAMCESALTYAILRCELSNSSWGMGVLDQRLDMLDRGRLLALGDPLPGGDRFAVYRGVAGAANRRQNRGLSWTSSIDIACWYAEKSRHFGEPAIYSATVERAEVYIYSNRRNHQEFVVRPRAVRQLHLCLEDIRERHDRIQLQMDDMSSPDQTVATHRGLQQLTAAGRPLTARTAPSAQPARSTRARSAARRPSRDR